MNIFILAAGGQHNRQGLWGCLNAGSSAAIIAARPDFAARAGFFIESVLGAGCGKLYRDFPDRE